MVTKAKPVPRGRNGGRKPKADARVKITPPNVLPTTLAALTARGPSVYKAASEVLDEWAAKQNQD